MRVVIDTNVLISAIFWVGKPKAILNSARKGNITYLPSEPLLKELINVLTTKDKPFQVTSKDANYIVKHLQEIAEIIPTKSRVSICKDDADNRVMVNSCILVMTVSLFYQLYIHLTDKVKCKFCASRRNFICYWKKDLRR